MPATVSPRGQIIAPQIAAIVVRPKRFSVGRPMRLDSRNVPIPTLYADMKHIPPTSMPSTNW